MRSRWRAGAMVLAAVVVAGSEAGAERLSRSTTDACTIQHESGAGRILFRADLEPQEPRVLVGRALARVPLDSIELSRSMTLRVHPVTTAWTAGAVSWTSGWTRPGGDFDDRLRARAEVSGGSVEAIFDITVIAKEMLEHGMTNYGFILTLEPSEGLGLPEADLEAFESLSGATVEVDWRRKPVLPARLDS